MNLVPHHLRHYPHITEHNWLIHELMLRFLAGAAKKYASGRLADIGCGQKPYEMLFEGLVSRHIGVDAPIPGYADCRADVIATAYSTALATGSCDTVLCTELLEHLEEPQRAVMEMNRILRPSGVVILTVPFFWPIHDRPRDYYRYTEYGLERFFRTAGFEIVEVREVCGWLPAAAQASVYFIRDYCHWALLPRRFLFWSLQRAGVWLHSRDRSSGLTNVYGLVARKSANAADPPAGLGGSKPASASESGTHETI